MFDCLGISPLLPRYTHVRLVTHPMVEWTQNAAVVELADIQQDRECGPMFLEQFFEFFPRLIGSRGLAMGEMSVPRRNDSRRLLAAADVVGAMCTTHGGR